MPVKRAISVFQSINRNTYTKVVTNRTLPVGQERAPIENRNSICINSRIDMQIAKQLAL